MNWLRRFMYGRYGQLDRLNIAVFIVYLALAFIRVILSLVFRIGGFLTPIGTSGIVSRMVFSVMFGLEMACVIVFVLRFFSTNIAKRTEENQRFTEWTYRFRDPNSFRNKRKQARREGKELFKCPVCKKTIRVPRGKGKIEITCPNCKEKFVRRT